MTTLVVYNTVANSGNSYQNDAASSAVLAGTASTAATIGASTNPNYMGYYQSGGSFYGTEWFGEWDTSPVSGTVNSATINFNATTNGSVSISADLTLQARAYNYGTFALGNYRTATQFNALTLCASILWSDISSGSRTDWTSAGGFTGQINNATTVTRLCFITNTFARSDLVPDNFYINFDATSGSPSTNAPRLTVDYTGAAGASGRMQLRGGALG